MSNNRKLLLMLVYILLFVSSNAIAQDDIIRTRPNIPAPVKPVDPYDALSTKERFAIFKKLIIGKWNIYANGSASIVYDKRGCCYEYKGDNKVFAKYKYKMSYDTAKNEIYVTYYETGAPITVTVKTITDKEFRVTLGYVGEVYYRVEPAKK